MVLDLDMNVADWLRQGGLDDYKENFAGINPEAFKRLLMQVRTLYKRPPFLLRTLELFCSI